MSHSCQQALRELHCGVPCTVRLQTAHCVDLSVVARLLDVVPVGGNTFLASLGNVPPWAQFGPSLIGNSDPFSCLSVTREFREQMFAESTLKAVSADEAHVGDCDTHATTKFNDEAVVQTVSYSGVLESSDIAVRLQSVIDYLEKPLLVGQFAWSNTSIQNSDLFSVRPMDKLSTTAIWKDKISGFGLYRGTACLRIQLNTNPFQQGKLLLYFLPLLNATSTGIGYGTVDTTYVGMHGTYLPSRRQLPCVELDCRDGVGILKMPFIAPTNWMESGTNGQPNYDWGWFKLAVLSPLEVGSGGETTADVSVYLWFEDMELAAPMVPQSYSGPKKKFSARSVSKKDHETKELEAFGKPVSSALRSVSSAAGSLSMIPLLAPVARPVEWATGVAAQVASALGWSKPTLNIAPGIMSTQYNRYAATSDGPDPAYPLSLVSDNKIRVTDQLSIYDGDEMSWGFLKKVCTIINTFDWTTSQLSGTSLLNTQMGPRWCYQFGSVTYATHTANFAIGPPLYLLSHNFNLWRGSIKVTFKIAKTDYHSGCLQLTWTPGNYNTTAPSTTTSAYSLREIIDIRCCNEFEFVLPWMVASDYLPMNVSSGWLNIQVLNELRAPETCSGAIQILMYVSGGDDLEYAAPGFNITKDPRIGMPFSPQVGGDECIASGVVGSEPMAGPSTRPSELCVGEMFLSIKQLLNRYSYMEEPTKVNSDGLLVYPWHLAVQRMNPTTGAMNAAGAGADIYSRVASMYLFRRGGARVSLQTTTGVAAPVVASFLAYDPYTDGARNPVSSVGLSFNTASNWSQTGMCSGTQGYVISNAGVGQTAVYAPYYSKTKVSINAKVFNGVTSQDYSQPGGLVMLWSPGGINGSYGLFRSFPDDFQLSYFIGAPPVFISNT